MNLDSNNKYHSNHRSVLNETNEEPESEVKKMATGEDGKAIQINLVKRSYETH